MVRVSAGKFCVISWSFVVDYTTGGGTWASGDFCGVWEVWDGLGRFGVGFCGWAVCRHLGCFGIFPK